MNVVMNVSKIENEPIILRRMPATKPHAGNIQSLITGKDLPPTLAIQSDCFECQASSNPAAMFKPYSNYGIMDSELDKIIDDSLYDSNRP